VITALDSFGASRFLILCCLQGLGNLLSIGHLLSDRSDDLPLLSSLRRLMVRELQVLLDSVESVIDLAGELVPQDEQDTLIVHVKSGVNHRVRDSQQRAQNILSTGPSFDHVCSLLLVSGFCCGGGF